MSASKYLMKKKLMLTLLLFRTRDEEILIKLFTAAWWKTRSKVMMVLTFSTYGANQVVAATTSGVNLFSCDW